MRRHTRIAATAAIALSLLLAPHSALAEDKPDKPKTTAEILAIIAADPFEGPAHDAYTHMWRAKDHCDPGGYAAHRSRLLAAIASMRFYAKKAKKLKAFSKHDPEDLIGRAEDFESLIDHLDKQPWPCPSKATSDGHSSLPFPAGTKADPPDWAIALAGHQANAIHDGFDNPGAGSFNGIAMVDHALRAARGGMGDAPGPNCPEEGGMAERGVDRRFPGGFAPFMPAGPASHGYGGWGW